MLFALSSVVAAAVDDTSAEVHLWPLIENAQLPDGKHRLWALGLYHRTTNPDGSTYSWHVLNYLRSREFSAALPLWYQVGAPERRHSMLVPLWFQGPGYVAAPLLLTGSWKKSDGDRALWVTPFFHLDTKPDGGLDDLHALNYFQGENYRVLFPLAYESGWPGEKHRGVVPLWFSGPDYWLAPQLLSAHWRRENGGTSTWVTPLAHVARDRGGDITDAHVLNYVHGKDFDTVFPLLWVTGRKGHRHYAVVPLWFQGERWWCSPLVLSGSAASRDGGSRLWVTPLVHLDRDRAGAVADMHVLNYLHGRDFDVFFPLLWATGREGHRHYAAAPLWFQGERWWCAPPLLSGRVVHHDGSGSLWATPLVHIDRDRAGAVTDWHALTWINSGDLHAVLPFFYQQGPSGDRHIGVVPLWFQGRDYRCAPLALSLWHRRADGSDSTWITPLAHLDRERDGSVRSLHGLTYFQGRHYRVLFPLGFDVECGAGDASRHWRGVVPPLYLSGPGWRTAPLALSGGWRRADGGRTTWVTPLFHLTSDAKGRVAGFHALNVFHDRTHDVLFPLAWSAGEVGQKHRAVVPVWFSGPTYATSPVLLSAHWRCDDGGHATWITPLFHRRTAADGTLRHEHLLTWVATPAFQTAFPLYWSWRTDAGGRRSLLAPLYYRHAAADGDTTTTVPPALFSYRRGQRLDISVGYQLVPFLVQNASDGHEINLLWRLFHLRATKGVSELTIAPLWWSERHEGAPSRWQILGGLIAKNCNYQSGNYRYYAFWLIPLGGHGHFTPHVDPPTATTPTAAL